MAIKSKLFFNDTKRPSLVNLFALIESSLPHASSPLEICKNIDRFSCFLEGDAELNEKEVTNNMLCFSIVYLIKSFSLNPQVYDCRIFLEGSKLVVNESCLSKSASFSLPSELFVHDLLADDVIRIEMLSGSNKEITIYLNDSKVLVTEVLKPRLFLSRKEQSVFNESIDALPYIYYFQLTFKAINNVSALSSLIRSYFLVLNKMKLEEGIETRVMICVTNFIYASKIEFEKKRLYSSLVCFLNWIVKEISLIINSSHYTGEKQCFDWNSNVVFLKSDNALKGVPTKMKNEFIEHIEDRNDSRMVLMKQIYNSDNLYISQGANGVGWTVESDNGELFSFEE